MTSNGKRRQSRWQWVRWLAVAISVAGIIYLLVWYVPAVLTRRNANASVESAYISAVAGFLGVLSTAAVAVAAFWYSSSTNRATIAAAKATTEQTIDAAREAQVPDRYTRAIEQLGSGVLDVRIGGIYALERVARDSAKDHPTVMEVLTAFIRQHSGEQWPEGGVSHGWTRPDVQAAVTVVGRRNAEHDLSGRPVDLYGANFFNATLVGANLRHATLRRANLSRTHLSGAILADAILRDADLREARDLDQADLDQADLTGARWSEGVPVPEGWELDTGSGRLVKARTDSGAVEAN